MISNTLMGNNNRFWNFANPALPRRSTMKIISWINRETNDSDWQTGELTSDLIPKPNNNHDNNWSIIIYDTHRRAQDWERAWLGSEKLIRNPRTSNLSMANAFFMQHRVMFFGHGKLKLYFQFVVWGWLAISILLSTREHCYFRDSFLLYFLPYALMILKYLILRF